MALSPGAMILSLSVIIRSIASFREWSAGGWVESAPTEPLRVTSSLAPLVVLSFAEPRGPIPSSAPLIPSDELFGGSFEASLYWRRPCGRSGGGVGAARIVKVLPNGGWMDLMESSETCDRLCPSDSRVVSRCWTSMDPCALDGQIGREVIVQSGMVPEAPNALHESEVWIPRSAPC